MSRSLKLTAPLLRRLIREEKESLVNEMMGRKRDYFEFELYFDDESYHVEGTYIPGYPARIHGPPESWDPGEGVEVNIESISMFDSENETWIKLEKSDPLFSSGYFYDAVADQIEEDLMMQGESMYESKKLNFSKNNNRTSRTSKLTAPLLRRLIREEKAIVAKMNEAFTYKEKLNHLNIALKALQAAQNLEKQSDVGEDPDLNEVVASLEGLIDAVEAMIAM